MSGRKFLRVLVTPQALARDPDLVTSVLGSGYEVTFSGGPIRDEMVLRESLSLSDAAILGVERVTDETLGDAPRLRMISRFGAGHDSIDLTAAVRRGVRVAVTPGIGADAVARHTIALLLAVTHNLSHYEATMRAGVWERRPSMSPEGRTFGVVGFGAIGAHAARFASALGYRIAYWSRSDKPEAERLGYERRSSIGDLIHCADVVSLHLAAAPDLERVLGRDALTLMRGKILLNTARGSLVDEPVLLEMLRSGEVLAAGLDVFTNEPVAGVSMELCALPNVVATPHVGSFDDHTVAEIGRLAATNIRSFFAGELDTVTRFVA